MKSAQGQPCKKPKPRGALARFPFPTEDCLGSTCPVSSSSTPSPGCPPHTSEGCGGLFQDASNYVLKKQFVLLAFVSSALFLLSREKMHPSLLLPHKASQGSLKPHNRHVAFFKVRSENLAPKYQYLNILFPDQT